MCRACIGTLLIPCVGRAPANAGTEVPCRESVRAGVIWGQTGGVDGVPKRVRGSRGIVKPGRSRGSNSLPDNVRGKHPSTCAGWGRGPGVPKHRIVRVIHRNWGRGVERTSGGSDDVARRSSRRSDPGRQWRREPVFESVHTGCRGSVRRSLCFCDVREVRPQVHDILRRCAQLYAKSVVKIIPK